MVLGVIKGGILGVQTMAHTGNSTQLPQHCQEQ